MSKRRSSGVGLRSSDIDVLKWLLFWRNNTIVFLALNVFAAFLILWRKYLFLLAAEELIVSIINLNIYIAVVPTYRSENEVLVLPIWSTNAYYI